MDNDIYEPPEKHFGYTINQIDINEKNTINQTIPQIIIHGFPYDQGTYINGGRIGGEKASQIFRDALKTVKIYSTQQMKNNLQILDSGDLVKLDNLPEAHIQQTEKVEKILQIQNYSIPFLIGGSNDQSYCNVKALINQYKQNRIAVINIDSHFDVRPLKLGRAHSGSPFRQMLQEPLFQQNGSIFIEFAVKGLSCCQAHYDFLQESNCKVYWLQKDIRRYPMNDAKYSTQADAIDSQYCPGVSAPSVIGGLTDIEATELCYIAGKNKKVKMVDFSEFNPAVEALRTSHLLVNMFYQFCKGVALRE